MKIATWNVNSIRTRLPQVQDWLKRFSPDCLCLQETKVEDQLFPREAFEDDGYQVIVNGQKSYNGVAIISKHELEDIRIGLTDERTKDPEINFFNEQKRVISALVKGIRVVNVYVPNGSSLDSEKFNFKLKWLSCLKHYLESQEKRAEPLCILGDFNIALEDKDIHNPQRLSGGLMASKKERDALKRILGKRLNDVFRVFEKESNHWSWWDYRSLAWARDSGWRIDHIYLSQDLIREAKSCVIHKSIRGNNQPSDHAPVVTEIIWPPEENDFENEIPGFLAKL